jgi:hypothetical protein
MKYTTTTHTFGAKDTVIAAIRKYNNYTSDKAVIEQLLHIYNDLNGNRVPHICEMVQIPVIEQGDE